MSGLARAATPEDVAAIRAVLVAAFPTRAEADLVEAVRRDGDVECEFVWEEGGEVAGHVLLSRMSILADGNAIGAAGLAPVAVLPARQGEGIGSALIERALDEARTAGLEMIFVLGNPDFYRRFGFEAALARPFLSPFAGAHFQAIALREEFSLPKSGVADYAAAFAALGG